MTSIPAEAISAFIGVVVGSMMTTGTTILLDKLRERRSATQIAMAFYGEVSALKEIVELRDYIGSLQQVIDYIHREDQKFKFQIPITKNYFRVYEENIGRIGLLDQNVSSRIASFYVKANSLLEDLKSLDEGSRDDGSVQDQLDFYRDMKRFFENTMEEASLLCSEIRERYS